MVLAPPPGGALAAYVSRVMLSMSTGNILTALKVEA
eukprot:SAG22_NODE_765_length_7393_cov_5.670003_6_plen_36_part_00